MGYVEMESVSAMKPDGFLTGWIRWGTFLNRVDERGVPSLAYVSQLRHQSHTDNNQST